MHGGRWWILGPLCGLCLICVSIGNGCGCAIGGGSIRDVLAIVGGTCRGHNHTHDNRNTPYGAGLIPKYLARRCYALPIQKPEEPGSGHPSPCDCPVWPGAPLAFWLTTP